MSIVSLGCMCVAVLAVCVPAQSISPQSFFFFYSVSVWFWLHLFYICLTIWTVWMSECLTECANVWLMSECTSELFKCIGMSEHPSECQNVWTVWTCWNVRIQQNVRMSDWTSKCMSELSECDRICLNVWLNIWMSDCRLNALEGWDTSECLSELSERICRSVWMSVWSVWTCQNVRICQNVRLNFQTSDWHLNICLNCLNASRYIKMSDWTSECLNVWLTSEVSECVGCQDTSECIRTLGYVRTAWTSEQLVHTHVEAVMGHCVEER